MLFKIKMDNSVKNLQLTAQIDNLELHRHTLINQLSDRSTDRALINSQISDVSKQINDLMIAKQKNTLTMVTIKKILQKYFHVLDKNEKMIITVKPIFTTDLFIIYYLSKELDTDLGSYILDVFKKEVTTLTIFDKTTWFNDESDVLKVYDNKLRGFENVEDYEGEEFVDRERFNKDNYKFVDSAQFKFYVKYLDDVQIQSICILNDRGKELVFDIKKVANQIKNVFRKNLKEKKRIKGILKNLTDEIPYAPPGTFYRSFPGGERYLEANKEWEGFHSFGRKRNSLKTIVLDIKYLKSL